MYYGVYVHGIGTHCVTKWDMSMKIHNADGRHAELGSHFEYRPNQIDIFII